jgi:PadR family transcriptional regulator, regulatory protein PadR
MDTQFKKGVLEVAVLSLLQKKDYYGYELVQAISEKIEISEGTLYPLLRRLKKEGFLKTYLKESKEGPSRKYYKLTKKGRENGKKTKSEWKDFVNKIKKLLEE